MPWWRCPPEVLSSASLWVLHQESVGGTWTWRAVPVPLMLGHRVRGCEKGSKNPWKRWARLGELVLMVPFTCLNFPEELDHCGQSWRSLLWWSSRLAEWQVMRKKQAQKGSNLCHGEDSGGWKPQWNLACGSLGWELGGMNQDDDQLSQTGNQNAFFRAKTGSAGITGAKPSSKCKNWSENFSMY